MTGRRDDEHSAEDYQVLQDFTHQAIGVNLTEGGIAFRNHKHIEAYAIYGDEA